MFLMLPSTKIDHNVQLSWITFPPELKFKRYLFSHRPFYHLICQNSGEGSRALGPSCCHKLSVSNYFNILRTYATKYLPCWNLFNTLHTVCFMPSKCGSRGRTGGSDPPKKSQDIMVSIGNKLLDPLEKVGPSPWKRLDSLWTLELR